MRELFFLIIIALFFQSSAHAKTLEQELQGAFEKSKKNDPNCLSSPKPEPTLEDFCGDLESFPNRAGDLARNVGDQSAYQQKLKNYFLKNESKIGDQFLAKLKDPKNAVFYKTALVVFGDKSGDKKQGDLSAESLSKLLAKKEGSNFGVDSKMSYSNVGDLMKLGGDPVYKDVVAEIKKSVDKEFSGDKNGDKRVGDLFPEVQTLLVQLIKNNIGDEKLKSQMVARASAVRLVEGDFNKSTDHFLLIENMEYKPRDNTIVFSGDVFSNKGDFVTAQLIAHKMTRAVQVCSVGDKRGDKLGDKKGDDS